MTPKSAPRVLRIGLATVVALDLVGFFFFVGDARARAEAAGAEWGWLTEAVSSPSGRFLLALAGLASVWFFARRPGRPRTGAVALGALILLSSAHTELFGSPWRHMFFSGLCLLGWLGGSLLARRDGHPRDEGYAATGARALLGAAYFSAALSKLIYGGVGWANGATIQASVINQTGLVADTWLNAYRVWVAYSPTVAAVLSVGTIVVEAAGIALIGSKRVRALAAFGLVSMHFNIFLLTGILYWESMALLVLFGLPIGEDPERAPAAPRSAALFRGRIFVPLAALLGVAWVGSVVHQGLRYHHRRAEQSSERGASASSYPVHAGVERIGPFVSGRDLAGWSISSLRNDPEALRVEVEGPPGSIVFTLTCESSRPASPFDLGDAHLVYEGDISYAEIQGIGMALRAEVERATGTREVCESLRAWREEAERSE